MKVLKFELEHDIKIIDHEKIDFNAQTSET
jgi:hypothetical protein